MRAFLWRHWEPWGLVGFLALLTAILVRGWLGPRLPDTPRQEGLTELHFLLTLLDELKQGRLPATWDPREFCGYPWLTFTSRALYVPLALLAHWTGLAATDVMKGLQFAAFLGSGLAMYLYVRALSLGHRGAMVAAVVYLWFPCHAYLGVETWIHSLVWLLVPLILYAEERSLVAGARWRWTIGLGALGALLILVSSEYAIVAGPCVAGYILAREAMAIRGGRGSPAQSGLHLVGAALVALGLTAFHVVPFLAGLPTVGIHVKQGAASTLSAEAIREFVISPSLVVRAIARRTRLPLPYGGLPAMYNLVWSEAWYPGLVAPLLVGLGLLPASRRPQGRAVLVALALALLQALDGLVPGNPFGLVPVLKKLFPFRSVLLVVVFLAALAGVGAQGLLGRLRSPHRAWAALVFVGLIVVDFAPSRAAFQGVERYFTPAEEEAQRWLAAHRDSGGYRLWEPTAAERDGYRLLLDIGQSGIPRYSGYYDNASPVYLWQLTHWGDPSLALRLASVRYAVLHPDLAGDERTRAVLARAGLQPAAWEVEGLSLYEAPGWQPYARAYPVAALQIGDQEGETLSLLAALYGQGIALVAGPLAELDDRALDEARRYRYVFLAGARERRPGQRAAWAKALGAALKEAGQAGELLAAPVWAQGRVTWQRPGPEEIRLAADLPEAAVVTVAEAWYPHWRVTVDGKPAPLLRVNYAFLGAWVPAGAHEVILRCVTPALDRLAGGVSLASVLGLAAGLGLGRRRRQRGTIANASHSPSQAGRPALPELKGEP